jgi:hypothetical protein
MLEALRALTNKVEGNAPPAPVVEPPPAPAPAIQVCYAIKQCDALRGPAIFLDWEDCKFYLEDHNDGPVEYEQFQNISTARAYLRAYLPAPAAADADNAPSDHVVVAAAAAAAAAVPAVPAPPVVLAAAAAAAAPPRRPHIGRGSLAGRHIESLAENAVACLSNVPRQPTLGELPKNWVNAMHLWREEKLDRYLNVDKAGWSSQIRSRYNKMKSIRDEVVRQNVSDCAADGRERTVDNSAYYMDVVRENNVLQNTNKIPSLSQDLEHYRRNNPTATRRNVVARRRTPSANTVRNRMARMVRQRQQQQMQQPPRAQQMQQPPRTARGGGDDRSRRAEQNRRHTHALPRHTHDGPLPRESVGRTSGQRGFDIDDYDRGGY